MNPALLETATTTRARRAAAARALADAPRRAQLGWADLSAWPAWADQPEAARQAWLLQVGAWAQAPALRQCIDGRVLQQLAAQAVAGSGTILHVVPRKTVASGRSVGREAQLYGCTASIAGRQCNAQ